MRNEVSWSRVAWWFVGCVAVGWLVVYNALRLRGDYPSEAAGPALIGAAAGVGVFLVGAFAVRGLHRSGRVVWGASEAAQPAAGTPAAWRVAAGVLAVAAVASLVAAVMLTQDFMSISGERPRSTLLLIAWNAVFGVWAGEEAFQVLRAGPRMGDVDVSGFDAVWFACLLSCVLAGVAFSRDLFPALHVGLVAVCGLAAAAVAVALWRQRGGRSVPLAVLWSVLVAVASIAFPILL